MSALKTEIMMTGYIRNNYNHSVPSAIINICCVYYRPQIIKKYLQKPLKHLLSFSKGVTSMDKFIFNNDILFSIIMGPNGIHDDNIFQIDIIMEKLSNNIDFIIVVQDVVLKDDSNCPYHHDLGMYKIQNNNKNKFTKLTLEFGDSMHFQNTTSLTRIHSIHSLMIKYRDNEKITYYPSTKAFQLKRVSIFNWNVNNTLIDHFKEWSNKYGQKPFYSPILNNIMLYILPDGASGPNSARTKGKFLFSMVLMCYPINVSEIKIQWICKTNFGQQRTYTTQHTFNELKIPNSIQCFAVQNLFQTSKLDSSLIFDVKMTITEAYDFDGNLIKTSQYADHNILTDN